MATTEQVQEKITVFVRQLSEELGEVDASMGVCWFDAIENRAIEIGDAVAAEIARQQSADRPAAADSACPQCGRSGESRGARQRTLLTRRGPTTVAEPEYFCPCCRKAFFPADQSARRGA
jgi:hypothetical protein